MGHRSFYRIAALLLLLDLTCAIPWAGPTPTPTGLMAEVGMSLLPTQAPGFNDIPKELLKRQQVPFPPPLNWCGFVNGDPSMYIVGARWMLELNADGVPQMILYHATPQRPACTREALWDVATPASSLPAKTSIRHASILATRVARLVRAITES